MDYKMKQSIKTKLSTTGRVLLLIFFFLLVVLPIYWMFITSIKTHPEIINAQEVTYFPKTITWENYTSLFGQLNYGKFLQNSIIVSITAAVAVTILSIFGGYALARYRYWGKESMVTFFLVTQMIPMLLVIIPIYILYAQLKMLDTLPALMIFYFIVNLPFCVITMRSFFERIPVALEEASWVDGCTKISGLLRIILPVMFPGIVAVFVFAFIGAWNELIAATIFTNTPDMWTIPVGLKSLIGKYNVQWGQLMAGGILALLPTVVLFVFVQRFVVDGLTAGSVKG